MGDRETEWIIGAAKKKVTENQIREFVIIGNKAALDFETLQIIAMDYLNKVLRKVQKFDKWPKDVKDLCASKGIIQDKQTGVPIFDSHIGVAWSTRAKHAESKLAVVVAELQSLRGQFDKNIDQLTAANIKINYLKTEWLVDRSTLNSIHETVTKWVKK